MLEIEHVAGDVGDMVDGQPDDMGRDGDRHDGGELLHHLGTASRRDGLQLAPDVGAGEGLLGGSHARREVPVEQLSDRGMLGRIDLAEEALFVGHDRAGFSHSSRPEKKRRASRKTSRVSS